MKSRSLSASQVRSVLWPVSILVAASTVGIAHWRTQRPPTHRGSVYVKLGYGGYEPAQPVQPRQAGPLDNLHRFYHAGQWTQVEAEATRIKEAWQFSPDAKERRLAVQAWLLAAYASGWRKDYATAAERLLQTQTLAAELPDHGARPTIGEPEPTLEEEAAFQHAVCTGAQGHKAAAEAEYGDFMKQYPQSILVHAAVKRIARYHGGDVAKDAEALWRKAMDLQHKQDLLKQREDALCGPECLAELLKRHGKQANVHALANEMHTTERGTTLAALSDATMQHGFTAHGLRLSQAGLTQQKLPAMAYLKTGHYVLVDQVQPSGVTVWDPDADGCGHSAERQVPLARWQQTWNGITLAVDGNR